MINNKRVILLLSLILAVLPVLAQEILLNETLAPTDTPTWGPNRKNFIQLTANSGQFLPIGINILNTKKIQNQSWGIRIQYKRRINSTFSAVASVGYNSEKFGVDSTLVSTFGGDHVYEKEQLKMHTLGYSESIRLNFNRKRGNHLGKYIDFGFFSEYMITSQHIGEYSGTEGVDNYKQVKVIESGLSSLKHFQYGILLTLGINKLGLYYKYRMSDWINDPSLEGGLPHHQIGISYAIVN